MPISRHFRERLRYPIETKIQTKMLMICSELGTAAFSANHVILVRLRFGTIVHLAPRYDSPGIVRFLVLGAVACYHQQFENLNGIVGQTLPEDQALALGETVLAVPSVGVR